MLLGNAKVRVKSAHQIYLIVPECPHTLLIMPKTEAIAILIICFATGTTDKASLKKVI